jgi:glucose-1-phosphate adenylyltransferase
MAISLARDAIALVLAGGNGTRLGELTRWQCKPAIPFAGQFRNIDFTLSNCVNSGVRRIAVLTQYKAQSLISHVHAGWDFLPRALGEFIDVWPAQQRLHQGWYSGTADAVYQNLDQVLAQRAPYTLVLAGDHIYKMDYRRLLEQHAASGAQVTIGCAPVPVEEAGSFGVLEVDAARRVNRFVEKPAPASLGLAPRACVLASMGIYIFSTAYLVGALTRDADDAASGHDFGRDILPHAVREGVAFGHRFADEFGQPGYWRDVGTIESYWQTHMEMLVAEPPLDLFDRNWPIRTHFEPLPPAKVLCDPARHGGVINSLIAGGTVVCNATVTNSVLSPNVTVAENSVLDEVVILPNVRIGANCRLRRVIVDSNTVVPDGTVAGGGRVQLLTRDTERDELRSVA